MTTRRLPLVAVVLMMFAASACSPSTGDDLDVEAGTVSNDITGDISVWSPSGGGPYPVVLLLHGQNADRDDFTDFGTALAAQGLTVFAPSVTRPRQQLFCFYAVTSAAASDHRGDSSRPITMVGHGTSGPYAIGTVIYDTGTSDPAECFGGADAGIESRLVPTLAIAVAPCPFDGPMAGLRDSPSVVVVSADEDERCRPEGQTAAVELFEGAGIDVSLATVAGADHWSVVFQTRQDNGAIVADPDSSAGAEVVQIIADAIADSSD